VKVLRTLDAVCVAKSDDIHDERNTLGDSGLPIASPPVDDALPMLREALLVEAIAWRKHFADRDRHFQHRVLMSGVVIVGALIVAPLEEVERDADEQSAGRLDPKRIRTRNS